MINSNDLSGAIRKLDQEISRETQELHEKEEELRAIQAEEIKLKQEIPVEERKLHEDKRKLSLDEIAEPRLRGKIAEIKRDQAQKHSELTRVHDSYEKALQKSKVKLR